MADESLNLRDAPTDPIEVLELESTLILPRFTATDAWVLGHQLRSRLHSHPNPCVISISLTNNNQVLFHTVTRAGCTPDNDRWVCRKRNTVLRWGNSSWWMGCKFRGDEATFAQRYGLGEGANDYAIHGGGVPIRVSNVEGVVAVCVVSGLKQAEDHMVVVEGLEELKRGLD